MLMLCVKAASILPIGEGAILDSEAAAPPDFMLPLHANEC